MAFRIGQKVRIVRSNRPEMIGVVTAIVSDLHPVHVKPEHHGHPNAAWPEGTLVHQLAVPSIHEGFCVSYPPSHLEPVDDGREPVAWTEEMRRLCGVKHTERA